MNFSYQECKLKCIGGSLQQNLFGDYQLSRILIHIHWWDLKQNLFGDFQLSRILINLHWWHLNTKSFRRFSAIRKTYWHAMVWHKHKTVSAIFSFQEHLLRCIGGTLTQNLFGELQLSRMHIDMPWWDFTTKSFRRFSAIKNTYSHALMGPKQKIFSAIFSYQKYSWTYIGGTLTQNLFGDFLLSRNIIDMHWWDFNTKSLRRFPNIKNTYWHALVRPQHKIFSVNFSYQECILTCNDQT